MLHLATSYKASREATLRRFAETSKDAVAAVFFQWKLKPTQKRRIGNKNQGNLFGLTPEEQTRDAVRLRINYSIPSSTFQAESHHLPQDKSVSSNGPIYEAACTGSPADGECDLELAQASGRYQVHAIPIWTPDGELGAKGENAVAAIIRPLTITKQKRSVEKGGSTLFDMH